MLITISRGRQNVSPVVLSVQSARLKLYVHGSLRLHCALLFRFYGGFCLTERFNGEWSRGRKNLSRTGCFSFSVRCMCQGQEHVLECVHGHVAVHAVFHHTVFPATVGAVKTCTFDCTAQLRERTCSATAIGCETWLCHPHSGQCMGRGLYTQFTRPCPFFAEVRP